MPNGKTYFLTELRALNTSKLRLANYARRLIESEIIKERKRLNFNPIFARRIYLSVLSIL